MDVRAFGVEFLAAIELPLAGGASFTSSRGPKLPPSDEERKLRWLRSLKFDTAG